MTRNAHITVFFAICLMFITIWIKLGIDINKQTKQTIYILPDSTAKQISEIHTVQMQMMKEWQVKNQYFDKENER